MKYCACSAKAGSCTLSAGGWIETFAPTPGSGGVAVVRDQGLSDSSWPLLLACPAQNNPSNCKSWWWWEQKPTVPQEHALGESGKVVSLWLVSYLLYPPPLYCSIKWAKSNVWLLGWEPEGAQKKMLKIQTSPVLGSSGLVLAGGVWILQREFSSRPCPSDQGSITFVSGGNHQAAASGTWIYFGPWRSLRCCHPKGFEAKICKRHLVPTNRNPLLSASITTGGRRKTFLHFEWGLFGAVFSFSPMLVEQQEQQGSNSRLSLGCLLRTTTSTAHAAQYRFPELQLADCH